MFSKVKKNRHKRAFCAQFALVNKDLGPSTSTASNLLNGSLNRRRAPSALFAFFGTACLPLGPQGPGRGRVKPRNTSLSFHRAESSLAILDGEGGVGALSQSDHRFVFCFVLFFAFGTQRKCLEMRENEKLGKRKKHSHVAVISTNSSMTGGNAPVPACLCARVPVCLLYLAFQRRLCFFLPSRSVKWQR